LEKENRCCTFSFQLKLLLEVEEIKKYPFKKLVIEKELTEKEYKETLNLLETLTQTYERDTESGLIDHSALLLHYAGMLCHKLPIEETLYALEEEGLYPALTSKLIDILQT
jgi:hypothetical protein